MRYFSILLLACFASTLAADDIGVALGNKAWLLLSEPLGPGPEANKELHPHAGDPGFPAPNWGGSGGYAPTELWLFDAASGGYSRVTQVVTNKANLDLASGRRTLYAPFLVGGEPFVLHYDAARLHDGASTCQVLKASAAKLNEGRKPLLDGVMLASNEYLDAPAVSPDGLRIVFRAFSGKASTLRVFSTADWKPVAESDARNWGRPVWTGAGSLAAVAYNAAYGRVKEEDPQPLAGQLMDVQLRDTLAPSVLLEGAFPPDTYSRAVAFDAVRGKLIVARQDGRRSPRKDVPNEIVVELRDGAKLERELVRFDHYRGVVIDKAGVFIAGVRDRAVDDDKKNDRRLLLAHLRAISPAPEGGDKDEVVVRPHYELSPDGRGGLQDLGDGVGAMLEPVLNPAVGKQGEPPLLHTLNVLNWVSCDTLRNPRAIQFLSAMARRFKEIDEFTFTYGEGDKARLVRPRLQSTLLGFDLDIKLDDKAIKNKKGRYLELFSNEGRKGGRIRVEDNISGNWQIYTVTGDGTVAGDWVFSNTGPDGAMERKEAKNAGMYDKLLSQIDSRKLLMLVGLELSADKGGLTFAGRDTWRDPITGLLRRIWVFKRQGAGKDAATMGFVADAPYRSDDMPNAHPLLVAAVAFAMAGGGVQSSILAFDQSYIELPDLSPYKAKGPAMILPKVVRAYARNDKGGLDEQFSATLLKEFDHPTVPGGKARCGYNVWGARQDDNFTKPAMVVNVK